MSTMSVAGMSGGFFWSSRRRHTRWTGDWSSDVCSSDLEAELHAVAVEGHLPHYGATVGEVDEELAIERSEATAALEDARARAEEAGVVLKAEVVAGHPAHAIIETARTVGADLIVIGHVGRSGRWGLLPGGTAERV